MGQTTGRPALSIASRALAGSLRHLPLGVCLCAAGSASAHDWYESLVSPSGVVCCTNRDCRPVDHRYDTQTRRVEVGIGGAWVPVDPAKLLAVPSPDGAPTPASSGPGREGGWRR